MKAAAGTAIYFTRISIDTKGVAFTKLFSQHFFPLSPPKISKLNFNQFKSSFTTNVNYLKRRFSSGDLSSEGGDDNGDGTAGTTSADPQPPSQSSSGQQQPAAQQPINPRTTSAPTSPTNNRSSILQRVQSLTGAAKEVGRDLIAGVVGTTGGSIVGGVKLPARKEGVVYLLVIDDSDTDWSKYFRSQPYITIIQSEFKSLSIVSSSDFGSVVSTPSTSFIPDFVLFRQNLRDAGADYKKLLISLNYARVGSVNSLQAIYNFQDKPWVFGQLVGIMKKLGRDGFPLISQNFYPDYVGMGEIVPGLPAILKIGHAHGGLGKIRAGGVGEWKDASSVVAVTGTYCTSEPYIEARCDVHIQKIGNSYKAFMRKGITGHWKSAQGSGILEQVPMNDKYRNWVDAVATLFGGLDICEVEVIISRSDSREYIIEVNDSAMSLLGESQEEDRRAISELVLARIEAMQLKQQSLLRRKDSESSSGGLERRGSRGSSTTTDGFTRRESQGSQVSPQQQRQSSTTNFFNRQNSTSSDPNNPAGAAAAGAESEDTMKNLRKTFAGIFGDM